MSCSSFPWKIPSITQFKSQFFRDFPYAPTQDNTNQNYVIDQDITQGITEASANFNPDLGFPDLATAQLVFLYLAAYYLVFNIQNAQKGLAGGSIFPLQNAGVGSVNVGYAIPERYAKDSILSMYTQNRYGMKYLNLVEPYLIGRINITIGTTTPF